MKDWKLDNVELVASVHPDSFFIPSESERKSQRLSNQVQLHFLLSKPGPDEPRAERMWVEVTKVFANGQDYEGKLINQPAYIRDLHLGDIVRFQSKHIAQVLIIKGDPRWLDCIEQAALVSRLVFVGSKTVKFAYREEPNNERDSGWRLFSGSETDEYNSDPSNIRICNIGWLTDFDPSLFEIFKSSVGSVFERQTRKDAWQVVKNWRPRDD